MGREAWGGQAWRAALPSRPAPVGASWCLVLLRINSKLGPPRDREADSPGKPGG